MVLLNAILHNVTPIAGHRKLNYIIEIEGLLALVFI